METLQSQLDAMRTQQENSSKDMASERARREVAERAMAVVLEEYAKAGAVLEGEKAIAAGLRREAAALQQQVGARARMQLKSWQERMAVSSLSI